MQVRAIFMKMRKSSPFYRLTRAILLAMMGFVMAAGAATAHDGRMSTDGHQPHAPIQAQTAHHSSDRGTTEVPSSADWSVQADHGDHGSVPCPKNGTAGHMSGNCCTTACHAALAVPSVEPIGSPELPGLRIVGLTGVLAGRTSGRTERPPKLS